ncbi:MAG: hypothetical protein ACXWWC_10180 [Chitinophagaceae bacterium]
MKRIIYHIAACLFLSVFSACSYPKKFTQNYYHENESTLLSIRDRFKKLYDKNPFSLEIKGSNIKSLGMEIHTDSIKYIYNFLMDEPFLLDTLHKYKFDVKAIRELINDMQKTHCTWLNNLDYYENLEKKFLVFISVRDKKLNAFLRSEKYFTLVFFDQSQPFDEKGRLLDKEDLKTIRLINGGVFRKINDKVGYALTGKYR